jgi:hypothetical protein
MFNNTGITDTKDSVELLGIDKHYYTRTRVTGKQLRSYLLILKDQEFDKLKKLLEPTESGNLVKELKKIVVIFLHRINNKPIPPIEENNLKKAHLVFNDLLREINNNSTTPATGSDYERPQFVEVNQYGQVIPTRGGSSPTKRVKKNKSKKRTRKQKARK